MEFASRIGAAASAKWKTPLVFAIDLSHDERTSIDADYPGVVFDLGDKALTPEFCLALATKLKSSTKGNSTVSIGSLVKIVQKVATAESRGGQWAWTEAPAIEASARLLDSGTGRVPWQKYIHFLISHFLPATCPLSSLSSLSSRLLKEGVPVPKKDGNLSLPLSTFLATPLWFEESSPPATSSTLKQAYASAFSLSNDMVDMTSFLLVVSCVPPATVPGLSSAAPSLGLYRAMVAASSGAHPGPAVTRRGLEAMLAADYTSPDLNFAESVFEGKGEDDKMTFMEVRKKTARVWSDGFRAVKVIN